MKIAIIGAGPAGIFASIFLKKFNGEVHLFEQNKSIGEKLKLTGGGRMNVTNKILGNDQYCSDKLNLLKNLFKSEWVGQREQLFEELGVKYRWEGNRAILASGSALKEVERLSSLLSKQKNLYIHLNHKVSDIKIDDGEYMVTFMEGEKEQTDFFQAVIVCGGGMFRIGQMDRQEKIYELPLKLGHKITALRPALCPLEVPNNPLVKFSGVSFNGKLIDGKRVVKGDILITHKGISGPGVLDFSEIIEGKNIELCFVGEISEDNFQKEFQNLRNSKVLVKSLVHKFVPTRLCDFLLSKSAITVEDKISTTSKEKFKSLIKNLFHFELKNVKLLDYQFAWTTKGGISLDEIKMATLESKLHKNLFFAGEILDVNGLCGGYNITFAAISAKVVSEAISKLLA